MEKLHIEHSSGCMAYCTEINGQNIVDMPVEKLTKIVIDLLQQGYVPDSASLQSFIEDIVDKNGEYEYIGHCDQCGDSITKTALTTK